MGNEKLGGGAVGDEMNKALPGGGPCCGEQAAALALAIAAELAAGKTKKEVFALKDFLYLVTQDLHIIAQNRT